MQESKSQKLIKAIRCNPDNDIFKKLLIGQQQIENGEVVSVDEVLSEMRAKYNY